MNREELLNNLNPLFFKGIAHRGLHDKIITENSLSAFKKAKDNKVAFELDVHLTKDNQLVVMHDSSLKRTTSKEGICEELTLKEIQDNYKLLDGEKIPSLQEVLSQTNEEVPIVIELKAYKGNYRPLKKRLIEELKIIKDKKNVWIISFDPRALLGINKYGYMRSLLIDRNHTWVMLCSFLFESIDTHYSLLQRRDHISYRKKHLVNVYTIETEQQIKDSIGYVDTITYQYLDPEIIHKYLPKI